MQIIRLWLKITMILAALGGIAHWLGGSFDRPDKPAAVRDVETAVPVIPPADAGAIRPAQPAQDRRVPRAPYQFNQ